MKTKSTVSAHKMALRRADVIGSLPKEEELYYEYSFRKHFYKYERGDIGYICVADENKNAALAKMFDEIRSRLQLNKPLKTQSPNQ